MFLCYKANTPFGKHNLLIVLAMFETTSVHSQFLIVNASVMNKNTFSYNEMFRSSEKPNEFSQNGESFECK